MYNKIIEYNGINQTGLALWLADGKYCQSKFLLIRCCLSPCSHLPVSLTGQSSFYFTVSYVYEWETCVLLQPEVMFILKEKNI